MSVKRALLFLAVFVVTCAAALHDVAAKSFETLLREADAARSGDADRYLEFLGELDQRQDEASVAQRQRLRYLHAYQSARAGDFNSTIAELRDLQDNGIDVDIRFRAGVFLANNLSAIREFSEGLRALEDNLILLPEITDRELRHQGMLTAGILYNQVGQYELALENVLPVIDDQPIPRNLCIAQTLRLEAQFHLGLLGDNPGFNEVIGQCLDSGEQLVAGFSRGYQARRMAESGTVDNAITYLESVLPEIEATRYPRLISEINALLAGYNFTHGDLTQAERHAIEAIRHGRGVASYTEHVVAAHQTLYEIAVRRGDTAAALDHHRRYAEADRAYLDNVKARELAFQMVRHETLQKTQTIELLNRRNEVLQLEQEVARQTATTQRLLLAVLIALLASILYWAYKVKRLQMGFRKLAETDSLTGLSNRHHFYRKATQMLVQAQRANRSAAVVMVDLDHFKGVNDRFGHASGDWVLKQVAQACLTTCRNGDVVGRLGGEEFALLLVACPATAAIDLADRCRERIAAIDTTATGHRFTITASFGIATCDEHGYDLQVLLRQADEALYDAKADGRNLVILASARAKDRRDGPPETPTDSGLRSIAG